MLRLFFALCLSVEVASAQAPSSAPTSAPTNQPTSVSQCDTCFSASALGEPSYQLSVLPALSTEAAPMLEAPKPDTTQLRAFSRKLGRASAVGALTSLALIGVRDTESEVVNAGIIGLGMVSVAGLNVALTGRVLSAYRERGKVRLLTSTALLLGVASVSQAMLSLALVFNDSNEDIISDQASAASAVIIASSLAEIPIVLGLTTKAVSEGVSKARLKREVLAESDEPTRDRSTKLLGQELNKGSAVLAKAWGASALLSLGMYPLMRDGGCCDITPQQVVYGGLNATAMTTSTISLLLYDFYRYQETNKLSSLYALTAVSAGQLGFRLAGFFLFGSELSAAESPRTEASRITSGSFVYGSFLSAAVGTILLSKALTETAKVRHQKKRAAN